jgi:hypothetical protein
VRYRRPEIRRRIEESLAAFAAVSDVRFGREDIPRFRYTRLNERYRQPIELGCASVLYLEVKFD